MEKKKKIMITAILAVLLIGATSVTLIMTGKDRTNDTATTETMEADKEDNKVTVEADAEENKEDNDKKKEDKKENTATTETKPTQPTVAAEENKEEKKEDKKENTVTTETIPTQPTAAEEENKEDKKKEDKKENTTEQTATTEKQKVWHEPEYEEVWVVDVPAHTEREAVDVKYVDQCYCGFTFVTMDEWTYHRHLMGGNEAPNCQGYFGDVPIYTYEDVLVPEQGHYEKKLVKEGYWE